MNGKNKNFNSALYGLLLVGGHSHRMKTDKSALTYFDKKQVDVGMELLSEFCSQTYLSCRKDQSTKHHIRQYEKIYDQEPFINIGPLGGLLSAMILYPQKSWLVLACDLPFVDSDLLMHLLKLRDQSKIASAFVSSLDALPEPLCAVYESDSFKEIKKYFDKDGRCPRKFLIQSDSHLIKLPNVNALANINTHQEFKDVTEAIHKDKD